MTPPRGTRALHPKLWAVLAAAVTLLLSSPAFAYEFNANPRWPGNPAVIRYSAAVKGSGDKWAVKQAVAAWNGSGVDLVFRPAKRSQAALQISYTKLSCGQGSTTVAFPPFEGRVSIGPCKGLGRYRQVQVVVHELGHAIGLDHEEGKCATMNGHTEYRGSITTTHPQKCSAPPKGAWRCRLLQKDDLKGARKLYGGKIGALGPLNCKLGKKRR